LKINHLEPQRLKLQPTASISASKSEILNTQTINPLPQSIKGKKTPLE
jgi:hypothetical protein